MQEESRQGRALVRGGGGSPSCQHHTPNAYPGRVWPKSSLARDALLLAHSVGKRRLFQDTLSLVLGDFREKQEGNTLSPLDTKKTKTITKTLTQKQPGCKSS